MRKATDVFGEWARTGKDEGMEEGHASSVDEMLKFSLKERNLLNTFNDIVLNIAEIEQINPTLFFSKKNQKEFIRFALSEGSEKAFKDITSWRRELISDPINKLLLNY